MNSNLDRFKDLVAAEVMGIDQVRQMQAQIAMRIVGPETLAADQLLRSRRHSSYAKYSDFEATEELAASLGALLKKQNRFDLRTCNESDFRDLWSLRQKVDDVGLEYPTYLARAISYRKSLSDSAKIRVSTLGKEESISHVMREIYSELRSKRFAS